jgi:hypothetical protein
MDLWKQGLDSFNKGTKIHIQLLKIAATYKNSRSGFILFFHPFIPPFDAAQVRVQLNKS